VVHEFSIAGTALAGGNGEYATEMVTERKMTGLSSRLRAETSAPTVLPFCSKCAPSGGATAGARPEAASNGKLSSEGALLNRAAVGICSGRRVCEAPNWRRRSAGPTQGLQPRSWFTGDRWRWPENAELLANVVCR
jgi:hypothetical protein